MGSFRVGAPRWARVVRLLVGVSVVAGLASVAGPASGAESHEHGAVPPGQSAAGEPTGGQAGLPAPSPGAAGNGILPPGTWTPAQVAAAADLVRRTDAALPLYTDRQTLTAQGFRDFGVSTEGYDHWTNPSRIDDDHILDPEFPESLVLRTQPDGRYRVEAAMFYLPTRYDLANIPPDLAWWPGWHTHDDELCVDDSGRFAGLAGAGGQCSRGRPMVTPPMMHVWRVDNRCGHRFAGLGVGGLVCEADHHGHAQPMPAPVPSSTTTTTTAPSGSPAPPAAPVAATPAFTG